MKFYLLDTNIVTSIKNPISKKSTEVYSTVVLSELMKSAEPKEFRVYQQLWQRSEEEEILIVPDSSDWLTATNILHRIARALKRAHGGKSPYPFSNQALDGHKYC